MVQWSSIQFNIADFPSKDVPHDSSETPLVFRKRKLRKSLESLKFVGQAGKPTTETWMGSVANKGPWTSPSLVGKRNRVRVFLRCQLC